VLRVKNDSSQRGIAGGGMASGAAKAWRLAAAASGGGGGGGGEGGCRAPSAGAFCYAGVLR